LGYFVGLKERGYEIRGGTGSLPATARLISLRGDTQVRGFLVELPADRQGIRVSWLIKILNKVDPEAYFILVGSRAKSNPSRKEQGNEKVEADIFGSGGGPFDASRDFPCTHEAAKGTCWAESGVHFGHDT
jgi:hypothetical protein